MSEFNFPEKEIKNIIFKYSKAFNLSGEQEKDIQKVITKYQDKILLN